MTGIFIALLLLAVSACSGSSQPASAGAASDPVEIGNLGEAGRQEDCSGPPKVDETVPWPVIHQGDKAHKAVPGVGPESDDLVIDHWLSTEPLVTVVGQDYLYQQGFGTPELRLFDLENMSQGPIKRVLLPGIWPAAGGGVVDTCGNTWWTATDRLYRVNRDFTEVIASQSLLLQMDNPNLSLLTNAVSILPDGNLMVSTMQKHVFIVGHETNPNGQLPLIATQDLSQFRREDGTQFDNLGLFGSLVGFIYRPVTEGDGSYFFLSNRHLFKVQYDAQQERLVEEVEWAFEFPNGENPSANAMIVNDLVCVATQPAPGNRDGMQHVYCLDKVSGALVYDLVPFPVPGAKSAHTLGAIEEDNMLFTIADTRDSNSGGVAGYDLRTGEKLWPNVTLPNVSQSFAIAKGNRKLYIISQDSIFNKINLHVIDVDSGDERVLVELSSILTDLLPIRLPPLASLPVVGHNGNLYYTWPNGMTRIQDRRCAQRGCD